MSCEDFGAVLGGGKGDLELSFQVEAEAEQLTNTAARAAALLSNVLGLYKDHRDLVCAHLIFTQHS